MRTERSTSVTRVEYVATPSGRGRDNPPNLGDLRKFVAECYGLPDHLHVYISDGNLNESGRHDTTFKVEHAVAIRGGVEEPVAEVTAK